MKEKVVYSPTKTDSDHPRITGVMERFPTVEKVLEKGVKPRSVFLHDKTTRPGLALKNICSLCFIRGIIILKEVSERTDTHIPPEGL